MAGAGLSQLWYGDNLDVLRSGAIPPESVDLVYLDPPFNSQANYNVLFKSPAGEQAQSQIEAFEDTWHWNDSAERAFDDVMASGHTDAAEMLRAMRSFLNDNDMMAYLAMMAVRLIALRSVLKSSGSLYLHCDPTASHYLKILLDAVFGAKQFVNEIVWKRTNSHNFKTAGFTRSNDTILYYVNGKNAVFNVSYTGYGEEQLKRFKYLNSAGRRYKAENLTFSTRNAKRQFEWRGTKPPAHRSWGFSLEELEQMWASGRILTRKDGCPRMDGWIIYEDETLGVPLSTCWTDVDRIGNTSGERLGYPTQKPLTLLERIISASSNPGDTVLDPFCGCGTTIHAAQKLGRRWLGIDVTHLAISLIEKRLKDAFPGIAFEVHGTPKDIGSARDLAARDKYQFQWWAVSLVDAVPFGGKKKGADGGVDGYIYFKPDGKTTEKAIVSVKGGANVGVPMVRELINVVDREKAKVGILITLEKPTRPMIAEAAGAGMYHPPHHKPVPKLQILTVAGLLNRTERADLPWVDPTMFARTPREKAPERQTTLL